MLMVLCIKRTNIFAAEHAHVTLKNYTSHSAPRQPSSVGSEGASPWQRLVVTSAPFWLCVVMEAARKSESDRKTTKIRPKSDKFRAEEADSANQTESHRESNRIWTGVVRSHLDLQ